MKIVFAFVLLFFMFFSAISVYADITHITGASDFASDMTSPANGDNLVLIITVLCLSAIALIALLITSIILKRKK